MQEDEEGVGREVGEVVGGELLKCRSHGRRFGYRMRREAVGIVLEFAGQHIHQYGEQELGRGIKQAEEDKPGIDRGLLHVKSLVKQRVIDEER